MKNASLIFLLLITCFVYNGFSQVKTQKNIHVSSDKEYPFPSYNNGNLSGFYKYLSSEVLSLMNKEDFENSAYPPTKLKMILHIDEGGKITDVDFPGGTLRKACTDKMKAKLLLVKGWKAAVIDGKPVKSTYNCNVNCILWQ